MATTTHKTTTRQPQARHQAYAVGAGVEVLTSLSTWAGGFRVARVSPNGLLVRRISDGRILPVEFEFEQVRPA